MASFRDVELQINLQGEWVSSGKVAAKFNQLEDEIGIVFTARKCTDCGGSKKYVGLHVVEDCSRCGGTGIDPSEIPF